jgi:four helix bundle protein
MEIIRSHKELKVYQESFDLSMKIYELSKTFPKEELYSLTSQIRRSSRSVSANIAEAFHRRKYPKSFSSKLNESEAEAAETQNWLDQALTCSFISQKDHDVLYEIYNKIIAMLINMQLAPEKWSFDKKK